MATDLAISEGTLTGDKMTNIQPSIEQIVESPEQGERVTLIVGTESNEIKRVEEEINQIGEVEERVPIDCLAVNIPEENMGDLCDIDGVTSIEIEGTWRAEEGNLYSQQDIESLQI